MSSLFRPAAAAARGRDDIRCTLEVGVRWVPTIDDVRWFGNTAR